MIESSAARVSVVVPLFNKGASIARTMSSILAQTVGEIEVIVVDDGSTDGGPLVVEQFKDRRIQLIRRENGGPGAARNTGVALANAPLVAFLDADDAWLPEFLERSIATLDAHPAAAGVSSGQLIEPPARSRVRRWKRLGLTPGDQMLTPLYGAQRLVALLEFMSPCATVIRRDVLQRGPGFCADRRCRYAEDTFLWLALLMTERWYLADFELVLIDTRTSELSRNYRIARPIEPFLANAKPLIKCCPAELQPLLLDVLKRRALKTACMLGFFGEWRKARCLMARWVRPGDFRLPLFAMASVCATPLGALVGGFCRGVLFLGISVRTFFKSGTVS